VIALPSLAQAPAVYATASQHAQAARCALLLAPEGPIAPAGSSKKPAELAQLERFLHAWMEKATRGLEIFQPALHLVLDRAPGCACVANAHQPMSLWLRNRDGDAWNTSWRLDRRWAVLQKSAPGMPAAALEALHAASRAGLPIYTPHESLGHCSWQHWVGENDERFALENWDEGMTPEKAEAEGFPTRRWLEASLPPIAKANRRAMSRMRLEQDWGPHRDVARAIIGVLDAVKAHKPPKGAASLHDHEDDLWCVGYGVTLRWNEADPMGRLFDDFANGLFEAFEVQETYGWLPIADAERHLLPTLAAIEGRIAVARAAEKLIRLIAERIH